MRVKQNGRSVKVEVTSGGAGLVSQVGSFLLAQTADRLGLTDTLSQELSELKLRRRGPGHGRAIRGLAVMVADASECVSDLGPIRAQHTLFVKVASDSTAYRVIEKIATTPGMLDALRTAHATARERFYSHSGAPKHLTIDVGSGGLHWTRLGGLKWPHFALVVEQCG